MTLPAQDIVERLTTRAAECATASASDDKDRFMSVVAKFTRADGVLMTEAADTISRLTADNEALRKERDEARETNRRLNRRVQRWEGNETSFRLSFEGWSKVLFATKYDRENHVHDFIDWQRQIDKAWANGRAEAAEDRADALAQEVERLRGALIQIAHTYTEDSHGGTKSLPAYEYQDIARAALGDRP